MYILCSPPQTLQCFVLMVEVCVDGGGVWTWLLDNEHRLSWHQKENRTPVCKRETPLAFPRTGCFSKDSLLVATLDPDRSLQPCGPLSATASRNQLKIWISTSLGEVHSAKKTKQCYCFEKSKCFWDVHHILAEEAVCSRHHPAGWDQSAAAEFWLADVDGGHPRVWARQSRAAPQDPTLGHWHSLLVLFPTNWFLPAPPRGSRDWDPSGQSWKKQRKISSRGSF